MQRIAGFFKSVINPNADYNTAPHQSEIHENVSKTADDCKGANSCQDLSPEVDEEELTLLKETVYGLLTVSWLTFLGHNEKN